MRKSSASSFSATPAGRAARNSMATGRHMLSSGGKNRGRPSGLRLSGMSTGRPSSAMVNALTGRPSHQDARAESKPQSDRSAFPKNLKSLITFLSENQYPFPLNKLQVSPSAKDVISIFDFLVSLALPNFSTNNGKFEEMFPQVLTMLRYPYAISKRQLQPVGSMHNWPTIVAGLNWLCTAMKINRCREANVGAASMTLNQPSKSELMVQFHVQAYNEYINGNEDLQQLDEDFCSKVPHLLGMDDLKFLKDLEAEVVLMEDKVQEIKDPTSKLQERLENLEMDHNKLESYVEESQAYHSKLNGMIEFLQKEIEQTDSELVSLAATIQTKEHIVATQRVTPEEAQKFRSTIEDLEGQISRAKETAGKLQAEIDNKESAGAQMRHGVISTMEQFNGIAESCQMIPTTAANAQGHDYELKPSLLDSEDSPQFIDIENRLDVILKQSKRNTREMRSREMESVDGLHKLTEVLTSIKSDTIDTEAKIRRKEEALEIFKQEKALDLRKLQTELESKEEEIANIQFRQKATADIETLQAEVQEQRKRYKELKRCHITKANEQETLMMNTYEKVLAHKQRIEERVERFDAIAQATLEEQKDKCRISFDVNRLDRLSNRLNTKVVPAIERCNSL